MGRKTVDVETLVGWVNTRLATPSSSFKLDDYTPEQAFRLGLMSIVEQVLHNTGRYAGFNYQDSEVIPYEERTDSTDSLRPGYDRTRVMFYIKP